VFDAENAVNKEIVLRKALLRQGCVNKPPVVHSDSGSAMKGGHVREAGRDTVLQSATCV
jgi:putative transposase